MSEQLLNDPQVGAALEQVGRERVAQRVRGDPLGEPGRRGRALDRGHACWRASRRPRSPRKTGPPRAARRGASASQAGSRTSSIQRPSQSSATSPTGHESLLVALADDPHEAAVERQVLRSSRRASLIRRPAA